MHKTLTAAGLAALLSTSAFAAELPAAAATLSKYLDPGRAQSNVGSQFYFNSSDPLIHKD